MTFDPRTAMLDKDRPPWLDDPHASPRPDLSPEQRGPRKLERLLVTVDASNVFRRIERWLRS